MVRSVFDWIGSSTGLFVAAVFFAGILLSAILAAAMSTADSQLLASASAFASDLYKPLLRKNASDKEMLWAGRIVVIVIAAAAFFIIYYSLKPILSNDALWVAFLTFLILRGALQALSVKGYKVIKEAHL
jgi:Na+/proline symporter